MGGTSRAEVSYGERRDGCYLEGDAATTQAVGGPPTGPLVVPVGKRASDPGSRHKGYERAPRRNLDPKKRGADICWDNRLRMGSAL